MSTWEVRFSRSKGLPYFFNSTTSESIWNAPEGLSPEQIAALPGAKEYLSNQASHAAGPEGQVRGSHLLIKHSGSRRPASWKNPRITTPKDQAINQLKEYESYLRSLPAQQLPEAFAKLANKESDCASHAKGGDLGWFGRGSMQKPFEDATFGLEPGHMSSIIDTESGVHLILRTG